ncbi:MAG TPA: acyl-CoA dehydrogenase family protein [Burkholderiales bacterium]|nr:acyl-CoA dehydrogenase family protein [Burkholderiales bacterium]
MRDDAIGFLLKSGAEAPECADVAAWWPRFCATARIWRNPMDRAIVAGFCADRVAWAFASGYQAALHALFPGAPEDRICALCVTEEDGNTPKAIKTSLAGDRLNGSKKWTTLGPDGGLFFVAARDEAASTERPAIRVARVDSSLAGIRIESMPATKFVPEVPHARLHFDNVAIAGDALLPGDGYEQYVRPFRTVEDLHVHGAILAYLVREARRLGWPQGWIERALSVLFTMERLSSENPSSPSTHLALAGTFAASAALVAESESHWKRAGADPAAARWERDRDLLNVAGGIRALRTRRAWERLGPAA